MMEWLLKLLPKQKMQDVGHGNVQAGRVEGDLCNTQHSNNQTIYNTYVVMSAQASTTMKQPPERATAPLKPVTPSKSGETTCYQRELLRFMGQSDVNEARAEFFMQREFGTVWVKNLDELQCRRTSRYVEACIRNEQDKIAAETQ